MVGLLTFAGMITAFASASLFGAYVVGFYDGGRDGERMGDSSALARSLSRHADVLQTCS
jgi:hypothetical protein